MAENKTTNAVEKESELEESASSAQGSRTRSPAYPGINLETAIKRARELYSQDKMNAVPVSIAVKRWGFKEKSSGGLITVAAMKSFGLLRDTGSGKDRKVALTDEARRIILDTRMESPDRDELIRQIALNPKIHTRMWHKWGDDLPADDTLRHALIFDFEFNENSVFDFIREYKDTIRFAKVSKSDIISAETHVNNDLEVGDYVQWESQGVIQFAAKRITGFSNDHSFAFVEGTSTGLPVSQLEKVDPPASLGTDGNRGAPSSVIKHVQPREGMNTEIFTLDEGEVSLQWPAKMSRESYEDFKSWLDLIAKKAKRASEKSEGSQNSQSVDDLL